MTPPAVQLRTPSRPRARPERPEPAGRASTAGPDDALFDDPADGPDEAPEDADEQPAALVAGASVAAGCVAPVDEARLAHWIVQVAERDERALSALYDATLPRVFGLVLRIVRRPAWAEEVVEDVYFQVWRQALRFDAERGRAMTWLLAMARSRAIDALRREDRHNHASLDLENAAPLADEGAPAVDELLAGVRGDARLHQALLGLAAPARQLVALAFFRGLSHEEIAEQTALPLGTVKSQIRRALITLRGLLGEEGLPARSA